MPSLGLSIFWFVVILAAIPLSLWWLKRSPLGASMGAAGARQPVRPVGSFALGPGQRLVTVEVGEGEARTWLVLGVTGQRISKLHVLPAQALPAAAATDVPPGFEHAQKFAAVLQRLRQPASARGMGAQNDRDPQ